MALDDDIKKKALAYGIADMLWMYGGQYPDRYFAETEFGNTDFTGTDLMAILYPFAICLVAGGVAYQSLLSIHKKEEKNQPPAEAGFEVAHTVFKGIAGWTAGYYFAEYQEFGMWGTAAMVGAGAVLPNVLTKWGYYASRGQSLPKASTLIEATGTFVAGFTWLIASQVPAMVGGSEEQQECMRAIIAPLIVLVATGICAAMTLTADKKVRSQSSTSS